MKYTSVANEARTRFQSLENEYNRRVETLVLAFEQVPLPAICTCPDEHRSWKILKRFPSSSYSLCPNGKVFELDLSLVQTCGDDMCSTDEIWRELVTASSKPITLHSEQGLSIVGSYANESLSRFRLVRVNFAPVGHEYIARLLCGIKRVAGTLPGSFSTALIQVVRSQCSNLGNHLDYLFEVDLGVLDWQSSVGRREMLYEPVLVLADVVAIWGSTEPLSSESTLLQHLNKQIHAAKSPAKAKMIFATVLKECKPSRIPKVLDYLKNAGISLTTVEAFPDEEDTNIRDRIVKAAVELSEQRKNLETVEDSHPRAHGYITAGSRRGNKSAGQYKKL